MKWPARISESLVQAISGLVRSLGAVIVTLALSFGIIVMVSHQPLTAFLVFTTGAFQSFYSFGSMLSVATILMLSGLAATVAFRAGAFNAGGEGQIYVGAFAAAIAAIQLELPAFVVILLSLAASMMAGALWVLVPALMRIYLGVTEIVTTLMAAYVAPLSTLR